MAMWKTFSPHIHSATRTALGYVSYGSSSLSNQNLALISDGAAVAPSFNVEAPFYGPSMRWLPLHPEYDDELAISNGKDGCGRPSNALYPAAHPDRRWCFVGSRGQLGVMLAHPALITNISIDHPPFPFSLANAPRDIIIWGVVDGNENEDRYEQSEDIIQVLRSRLHLRTPFPHPEDRQLIYVPLAVIFYNIRQHNLFQTFEVFPEIHRSKMDFGLIIVQVISNWGETYTALHHVGVYGEKAEGI